MLTNPELDFQKVKDYIKLRTNTYWYQKYEYLYASLLAAANFKSAILQYSNISCQSYADTFDNYTQKWCVIDLYYRQFLENYRKTNQHTVLTKLCEELNKIYSNKWLLGLSEKWQHLIDNENSWYFGEKTQRVFYSHCLKPRYLDTQTKVFVVISDALRY